MARLLALSAVLLAASSAADARPAGGPSVDLSHAQPGHAIATVTDGGESVSLAGAVPVHALPAACADTLSSRCWAVTSCTPTLALVVAQPVPLLAFAPKTSPPHLLVATKLS